MERINHPSATPDHKFTEGDPALGIPATTVTANYMNGSQEELMSIIEKSFQVGDAAQDDQALKGIFRLSSRENMAFNGGFQNLCRNSDTGDIPCVGGLPSSDYLRYLRPAGWQVASGTVNTAGNTGFYGGSLVSWSEPEKGFVNHVAPNAAGQTLVYVNPLWGGYYGGQFSLTGPGPGFLAPLQSIFLTIVMDVTNGSTSPGTLSVECQGMGSTISSPDFSVEVLEETTLTLSANQTGKISKVLKITNLGSITTPITGPLFKFTFNAAGNYSYYLKRYAIFMGAIPRAYLPEWFPSNDIVDRLFADYWSAYHANEFYTGPMLVPLRQIAPGDKATVGRLTIPLLFPAMEDGYVSGGSSWLTGLTSLVTEFASGFTPTLWMEDPATGLQSSMTSPPVTFSFVRLNNGFLHLNVNVEGFSSASPLVGVSIEVDLRIRWRR